MTDPGFFAYFPPGEPERLLRERQIRKLDPRVERLIDSLLGTKHDARKYARSGGSGLHVYREDVLRRTLATAREKMKPIIRWAEVNGARGVMAYNVEVAVDDLRTCTDEDEPACRKVLENLLRDIQYAKPGADDAEP